MAQHIKETKTMTTLELLKDVDLVMQNHLYNLEDAEQMTDEDGEIYEDVQDMIDTLVKVRKAIKEMES